MHLRAVKALFNVIKHMVYSVYRLFFIIIIFSSFLRRCMKTFLLDKVFCVIIVYLSNYQRNCIVDKYCIFVFVSHVDVL